MVTLNLNETPVRTSKNFNINNIKIENVELPKEYRKFNAFEIIGNAYVCDMKEISKLTYGTGEQLYENIKRYVNNNIKVIPKGEEVKLLYELDENNSELISNVEIQVERDTNIIIKYSSHTNCKCFVNAIIKLFCKNDVNVKITVVNLLNEESNFFIAVDNALEEKNNILYNIIDLGAKNSVQNYFSNLQGNSAKNILNAVYLGRENQIKDINYISHLYGQDSNIDIDVQGALKDSAKKFFKGTIDFKTGCKKSKGNENEYCMLLSDKAKSIALPMLLCTEDDVEGNHATASGKLDDKELFYIMSRGIEKKDAIKLIVKAKFNNILEKISDEELRNEIINEIDRRLE